MTATTKFTTAEIVERLAFELDAAQRVWTYAKGRMTEAMEMGFIDANVYERVIDTHAILKGWQHLDSALSKNEDTHAAVQAYIEDLTEMLLNWAPSNSTSDIVRVQDRAKIAAMRNQLRTIKNWI